MTTKEILIALVAQLEMTTNTANALESYVLSPKYAGLRLTPEQLRDLKEQAIAVNSSSFDALRNAIHGFQNPPA